MHGMSNSRPNVFGALTQLTRYSHYCLVCADKSKKTTSRLLFLKLFEHSMDMISILHRMQASHEERRKLKVDFKVALNTAFSMWLGVLYLSSPSKTKRLQMLRVAHVTLERVESVIKGK